MIIKMNNQLVSFAVVCKYLSITKAGIKLGKSKAHISRHILELEKEIGVKLFYRTTRSLTLTPHGEKLKETAFKLLDEIDSLNYKMSTLNDTMRGDFSITMPMSFSLFVFPNIMIELRKTFPDIKFNIIATNENENLICKKIDMAIRLNHIQDDNLIAHKVGSYKKNLVTIKSGNNNTFIKYSLDDEDIPPGYLNIVEVDNLPIIKQYIVAGIGEGFMPSYAIKPDDMLFIKNGYNQCHNIYIAYPYQSPLPTKLIAISKVITDSIKVYC